MKFVQVNFITLSFSIQEDNVSQNIIIFLLRFKQLKIHYCNISWCVAPPSGKLHSEHSLSVALRDAVNVADYCIAVVKV